MDERTPITKSADEWCAEVGVTVHDPDGWDRRNFKESWAEPLTALEFARRASTSTISGDYAALAAFYAAARQ